MHKVNPQNSVSIFKEHFWKFFIIDGAFVVASAALFIFARNTILTLLAQINQYAGDLAIVEQQLESNVSSSAALEPILATIEPIATKLNVFVFFFVPALFLILWCALQHANLTLLLKKKWLNIPYLAKMIVASVIPFAFGVFAVNSILVSVSEGGLNWIVFVWALLALLALYFTNLNYFFLENKLNVAMNKTLRLVLLASQKLLPLFVVYALAWMMLFFLASNIIILYIAGGAFLSVTAVFMGIAGIFLLGYVRALMFSIAMKN